MADIKEKDQGLVENLAMNGNQHDEELDPLVEKRLVRKLDRHIIPIIMLLYLLSFLDR